MTFASQITIVAEKVVPHVVVVKLNSEGIIEIEWDSSIEAIDKHHIEQTTQIIGELGGGKKMPVFVNTYSFMAVTEEARIYTTTKEAHLHTLANAVLIDNLAKKILFNFYIRYTKNSVPIKSFTTKEEAFEWLKSLQSNNIK